MSERNRIPTSWNSKRWSLSQCSSSIKWFARQKFTCNTGVRSNFKTPGQISADFPIFSWFWRFCIGFRWICEDFDQNWMVLKSVFEKVRGQVTRSLIESKACVTFPVSSFESTAHCTRLERMKKNLLARATREERGFERQRAEYERNQFDLCSEREILNFMWVVISAEFVILFNDYHFRGFSSLILVRTGLTNLPVLF